MIALTLALAALATPVPDHAALARAEADAVALIAACAERGPTCGADAATLGEAFLVRSAAAAVLRGEIDGAAAANARWLAPRASLAYLDLLPRAAGEPEPWVRAWQAGEVKEAPVPPPSGWALGNPGPHVVRLDALALPARDRLALGGALDARITVSGGLAAYLGAGVDYERFAVDLSALGTDVDRLDGTTGRARVGLGPRWTGPGGGDLMPFAYGVAEWGGATGATFWGLREDDVVPDPGTVGFGGGLGAVGLHPFARDLAFGWDARVEALGRRMRADYAIGRRRDDAPEPSVDLDAAARDRLDAALRADLRWRVAGGSATLAVGGLVRVETPLSSSALPGRAPATRGGPVLGFSWDL